MDARCIADDGRRDAKFEARLRECLRTRHDSRRVLAAYYFLEVGAQIPAPLLTEFWASEDASERGFAFDYFIERVGDQHAFWAHIEAEDDPVVVEAALSRWVRTQAYTGDPRLLVELRRVLGTRRGRPMIAVELLSELLPEAGIDIHYDPEALVTAWKKWLDANMQNLAYDAAIHRFRLTKSARR